MQESLNIPWALQEHGWCVNLLECRSIAVSEKKKYIDFSRNATTKKSPPFCFACDRSDRWPLNCGFKLTAGFSQCGFIRSKIKMAAARAHHVDPAERLKEEHKAWKHTHPKVCACSTYIKCSQAIFFQCFAFLKSHSLALTLVLYVTLHWFRSVPTKLVYSLLILSSGFHRRSREDGQRRNRLANVELRWI